MLSIFRQAQGHTRLLSIAVPLVLANITTPLLGLVDTAILGRMDGLHYLAGAAIASLILTQLYWVCGFIKMSITGLSAQHRASTELERIKVLLQGGLIALVLAACILLVQTWVLSAGLWFAKPSVDVAQSTTAYFDVRVWGAPAALLNLAIVGWLIGQQKSRLILFLQVAVNIVNIIASYSFVYIFGMQVEGVALGTVLAEYSMTAVSLWCIYKGYFGQSLLRFSAVFNALGQWFSVKALRPMLSLNSDMLIRNLALQFTLAFVTLKGAQFGTQAIAINAILMQFFALIALGLDGIANAVEALVGEAKGRLKHNKSANASISKQVNLGIFWSSLVAIAYTLIFLLFASHIIALLSDKPELMQVASNYMWVIYLLPLVAHWCFLFDGVYVGLSQGKAMRNNMIVSTFFGFIPAYILMSDYGNQALWLAMFAFLALRGLGLGAHYYFKFMNHRD